MADVDARLREIAERAERAIPGPWCYMATGDKDNSWSLGTAVWPDDTPVSGFVNDQEQERFDEETMEGEQATPVDLIAEHYGIDNTFDEADFIAHAREDVPWLLALLKERDERIETLERETSQARPSGGERL